MTKSFTQGKEEKIHEDEGTVRYGSWSEYIPTFLRRNSSSQPDTSSNCVEIKYEEEKRHVPVETDIFWLVLNDMDSK